MAESSSAQEVEWKPVTALPIADTEFTVTGLKDANKEFNFRVIASNDVGASDASIDCGWVLPEEIVEEPGFELDTECQRTMMIRAGQTIRMGMKLKGKPLPTIKWTKSEGEVNELALTETVKNYAMLMIENCTVLDTGRYEFLLESSSGQKEGAINVRVMDAPSAPQNVTAGDVSNQEVKVTWDAPANDGCANITHYIVEKRTASKKSYMTVSENCERDSIVVKGLITGESYFFRITAVNKYGNGREGINAEPVIIAAKPDQPLSIDVVEMTKNTGTIAWTKPHSDGGSPISGYVVELARSVVGAETWIKQGTTTKMTYTCRDLSEKAGYVFRVRAVNAIGASDATETRLSAIAVDEIIAPELDTKALYMSSYTVKAGDDVVLNLPVIGKPAPMVKWQNVEGTWRETQRCNTEFIKHDDGKCSTQLNIKECVRSDASDFIVTLKNKPRSDSSFWIVHHHLLDQLYSRILPPIQPLFPGLCQLKMAVLKSTITLFKNVKLNLMYGPKLLVPLLDLS
jgi:titin